MFAGLGCGAGAAPGPGAATGPWTFSGYSHIVSGLMLWELGTCRGVNREAPVAAALASASWPTKASLLTFCHHLFLGAA